MTTANSIHWNQTRAFECCGLHQEPVKTRRWDWDGEHLVGRAVCTECGKQAVPNGHAGFTANKLYSPFVTVATLAETWLRVKDDIEQKRVFVNTALAQSFEAQAGRNVEAHTLINRREDFGSAMPREIVRLTAGVDVQGNRLECHVVGWGLFEEAWSAHYEILEGDPANPDVWKRLDELLRSRFPHALGVTLPISATCVDSGHLAQKVHDFCRPLAFRNVWAVKGSSWSKKGDPVWPVPKSMKYREAGNKPVVISVDSAKDFLRAMMMVESPGPGFFHLPKQRSEAWCEQLVAERCIFETKGGMTVRKWVLPKGRANEALDTLTYAYAALCGLKARGLNLEKVASEFAAQAAHYRAKQLEPVS
jgi:phage terminase large subunit GpA-like protein